MKSQPTKTRIGSIDALRGFALFGILVVNIFVFHAPYGHYGPFYFSFQGAEIFVLEHMFFLFVGKFMFIFAFLFGYGCWMQYEKYNNAIAFRKFWWRRMLWLALFGILHVLMFSYGDILFPYAVLGMSLPFVLALKNRTLIFLFLLVYLLPVYEFVLRQLVEYPTVFTQPVYDLKKELAIGAEGSFWDIFQLRIKQYFALYNEKAVMYIPKEWSLFLLGILASRSKMASQLFVLKARIFLVFGLMVIACHYLFRPEIFAYFDFKNSLSQSVILGLLIQGAEFVHSMFYIVAFWLLWRFSFFQNLFSVLKYSGRMSLTIYLMQSLICSLLFCGYGLGWYGSKTPTQLIWMAFMIYVFQLMFAVVWFEYFKFGPIEGLWRKLSYRK